MISELETNVVAVERVSEYTKTPVEVSLIPDLTYFRYINDMFMYLSVIQILDIKLRLSKINLVVSDIYRRVLALEIQSFTT